MDLRGDVETRRQESLHTAGSWAGPETSQAFGAGYQGIDQVRQATAGDDSGRGIGNPTDQGTSPPTQSLEEDARVVSRSSRPYPAARLGHTLEDHGGA